ncbi:hypothetical protein D9M72_425160 [compost metagenome]
MQAEHGTAHPALRAVLHDSHGEVAELHRRRKGPLLQGRPHLFGNPWRYFAAVDHGFGAFADSRIQGADQRLTRARRGQLFRAELAFFVADSPIGPGLGTVFGVLLGVDHLAYESSPRTGCGEDFRPRRALVLGKRAMLR